MSAITQHQEERLKQQIKKLKQINWNVDCIYWFAFEYDFKIKQHSDTYFSLYFTKHQRLDYWCDKNVGQRFYKNQSQGKPFEIPDIEAYLLKYFKVIK